MKFAKSQNHTSHHGLWELSVAFRICFCSVSRIHSSSKCDIHNVFVICYNRARIRSADPLVVSLLRIVDRGSLSS
jgi:hypothetical protein